MRFCDFIMVGPVWDTSGTSEVNRNIFLALTDLGAKVKLIDLPGWSHLKADLHPEIREKIQAGFDRNDIQSPAVLHCYPPHAVPSIPQFNGSAFNVSYTVFETDKCPIHWRDALNQTFLENWVPCKFQVESYANTGVDKAKLRAIPFGIDTKKFNTNVRPMEIEGAREFKIVTALDWSLRKNPQAMLAAYLQEFADDEDVTFVIKAYTGYGDEDSKNKIRNEIRKMRAMTRSKAHVVLITDFIHSDLMPSFHKAANVWLNLSRGEGWDLGSTQSMACGIPVIATDNTAHQEYMENDDSYLVKCTKVPITNKDFLVRTPQFIDHSWWEADVKDARKKMREAYEDWKTGKIQEKGKLAREKSLLYSWRTTAARILFQSGKFFK